MASVIHGADGDARRAVIERGDDRIARHREVRAEADDGAGVRLARLARVAALDGDAGQVAQSGDPALHRLLVAGERRFLVLRQRPLDSGKHAEHLLLADFHRAAEAVVRAAVEAAGGNNIAPPEHEAGRIAARAAPCRR